MRVRVYDKRKTTQDLINEERARLDSDFNARLKNAEESMKAIYPEEYKKIRSRYFGNGNNLGLIGSQYNYIHDMITRRSNDQMKKYYNELNDYFIKQTGTEPGYMLPGVDVVDEAPDFNALRQKDFDRFYSPTENSDYINTVEKENARNAYLALQNKNGDGTFDHDGYFDYDPNNGLLNTEANYARATGSYNYTPEEREAAATWERAQNSPIVTAMEFSPLFPVVAGAKAAIASSAPQASGVDVGMNAAFASLPAVAKAKDAVNVVRKLLWNKMPQTTDIKSIEKKITDIYNKYEKDANSINKDELQKLFNEHRRLKAKEYGYNIAEKDNNIRYFGHSRPGEKNEDIIKVFNTDNDNMVFLNADYPSWGYGHDRYALNTVYKNPITIDAQNNEWYSIPVESIEKVLGKKLSNPEQYMRSGIKLPNGNIVGASKPNTISINHLGKIFPENDYIEIKNVIDKGVSPEMWNDYAKETGYIFDKNTDYHKIPYFNGTSANTQVMVRNPYQMKKISPITFDNNGKIIPISQRNDFSNLDINYSNGGVLDATYMEQISRIRQPRFAGWRMNGRRPIIKSRRELLDRVNNSGVNFVERMKDANREKYWFGDNNYGTHLMSWATQDGRAVVYPKIQEKNGELVYYKNDEDAIDNAIMNNDVLYMTPREARWFTKNYKKYYPEFADGGIHIKEENRGKFTQQANNAGMGVQEFAKHVLANKDNYSSTTIKRANFARNATKFNH